MRALIVALSSSLLLLAGCGGSKLTCNTGTHEESGACVPDVVCGPGTVAEGGQCVSEVACGPGTTASGGQCVPDGTILCQQGTRFDAPTGRCVVDPSACAAGTVLIAGRCITEDANLKGDVEEAAEPNELIADGGTALAVPALGASLILHGCVTPRGGVPDVDPWLIRTSAPVALDITADGVGGLVAGFSLRSLDVAELSTWQRVGSTLTSDTAQRQTYLPAAGTYVLTLQDLRPGRYGASNVAYGNATTCYFVTLKTIALPAATPATLPQTIAYDDRKLQVLQLKAPATAGDLLTVVPTPLNYQLTPAAVVVGASGPHVVETAAVIGGFTAGETLTVVLDARVNTALYAAPYTLDFGEIPALPLPMSGAVVVTGRRAGADNVGDLRSFSYLWFDVATAGAVWSFDVTSATPVLAQVVSQDVTVSALSPLSGSSTIFRQYARFPKAGRYYLALEDSSATAVKGASWSVTSTVVVASQREVELDTAMVAQPLPAHGSAFFTLHPQASWEWLELNLTAAANWGTATTARLSLYDLSRTGLLGLSLPPVLARTVAINGTQPFGFVPGLDGRDYLLRVEDPSAPAAAATFTLSVKSRLHTSLGAVTPASPIVRTGLDHHLANELKRYFVTATAGDHVRIEVQPPATSDVRIELLAADEGYTVRADTGAAGATERLDVVANGKPIAFTLTSMSPSPADLNVSITATPSLAFVDACGGGSVLASPFDGFADDDFSTPQALPAGFTFYGVPVTQFIAGANGFLVFGDTRPACASMGCYARSQIPSAIAPNNLVAPYWADLWAVKVCRRDDAAANTVTLQWAGQDWGGYVKAQFQAVLHANGSVDFLYGPEHRSSGINATIGIENAAGTAGQTISTGAWPNLSYSLSMP